MKIYKFGIAEVLFSHFSNTFYGDTKSDFQNSMHLHSGNAYIYVIIFLGRERNMVHDIVKEKGCLLISLSCLI